MYSRGGRRRGGGSGEAAECGITESLRVAKDVGRIHAGRKIGLIMTTKVYEVLPEAAIEIREKVFVEEQGFAEEFDSMDKTAFHMVVYDGGRAAATCRYYEAAAGEYVLGRIAVLREYRGRRIGAEMIAAAEDEVRRAGGKTMLIHAQTRTRVFYEKQGYAAFGDVDFEENREHIWMKKAL